MFQFTTTTIINSAKDSNGTTDKFSGSSNALVVTRVGKFLKSGILSLYKRPYQAGVKEVATIVVPATSAGKVVRLEVDVRLSQSTQSEYANTYLYFKKPIVVEIVATGVVDTDGAALVAQIKGLKDKFGVSYISADYTAGTDTITLTATDDYQRFYSVKLLQETASYNSIIQPEYEVLQPAFTIATKGSVGFGDEAYMIKSLMIPTQENVRHFGINSEERPILGGNYSQYTLRYEVAKSGDDGIVSGLKSVTTHVFYVKSDLVSAFETEIAKLGLTVPSLLTYTVEDESLANSATTTSTVTNAIGAVTFSRTSGTSATINATTGAITADPAVDGDTVFRATDSVGNYAEVTITVA